jgi:excisionase family DNA binding protein
MEQRERELFYTGAALYLNLDSEQVDAILIRAGLDTKTGTVTECRAAVRKTVSRQTWEAGAAAGRMLFDSDAERLLTTDEVAERLGVTPRRVRALAARREVGKRIGGAWLFRLEDLQLLQPDPRYKRKP